MRPDLRSCCALLLSLGCLLPALAADEPRPPADADAPPPRRMATTEEAIRFFEARVERNPRDFMSRTILGRLCLRLARETGDEEHSQRAEAELRKALQINAGYVTARAYLASALLARHAFAEALELAEQVHQEHPGSTHALATIGDACLELGRYDDAETAYGKLEQQAGRLPEVLARLAHLAELRGRPDEAIKLLEQAAGKERQSPEAASEIAWYEFRLGEVQAAIGRFDAAARHFESALQRRPDYAAALLGLGGVRAMQQRYAEAAPLYERAVALKPEFDTIGELALVQARAGNDAEARRLQEQALSLIPEAARQETEARHLSLFLSDRDLEPAQALALAEQDLQVRQDVYAYDTLAWALYRNGKLSEAAQAAQQALRLGTRDANLWFHAGMIAHARGEPDEARRHLSQALRINPRFSLLHAETARRLLDELGAPRDQESGAPQRSGSRSSEN